MNQQKPKTKIKNGGSEVQREISHEFPDWLKEFRENLVDESTATEPWSNQEQGSQDTSKSSHELPMERRAKVEAGSGKHSVKTNFPKDPNCDFCLKTKITRASCGRRAGTVVPRQRITKFSVKKVNRGTTIDMPWWYKTWQHNGYNHTRVKQKLPRKHRRT